MNNVIFLVVDSVTYEFITAENISKSPIPFINSLASESIIAEKMYSHGPYTDAAIKSLYTGRNCLDDFGYYFKLNSSPVNHFKVFKECGFETFGFYYPYFMIGNEIKKNIDHSIYTSKFAFDSEWGGIYSYYSNIMKCRSLSKLELNLLTKRTRLMFECWEGFYSDLANDPNCSDIIKKNIEKFDFESALKALEMERNTFDADPVSYIYGVLTDGKDHTLWSIDKIDLKACRDDKKIKYVLDKYEDFFEKIEKINRINNYKHNLPSFRRIANGISNYLKCGEKSNLLFIKNFLECNDSIKKMKEAAHKEYWEYEASAYKTFCSAIEHLKSRDSGKPFYLSLHVEDPHEYIDYFSYDVDDLEVIDNEFNVLKNYLDEIKGQFKGSISYYLSLRYIDYSVQRFVADLKRLNVWDNTTLVIVADHGSSYGYYPVHNQHVNCIDNECYHIPFIIRHPQLESSCVVKKYCSSKDVIPTLLDVLGLECDKNILGKSILSDSHPNLPYVLTEYAGPGCPDLTTKDLWLSARDEKYCVGVKASIDRPFDKNCITEFYNYQNDPKGFYNIVDSINQFDIDYLLNPLINRLNEIKKAVEKYKKESSND